MKKNKNLKKQVLLYKKEVILSLKKFMSNEIKLEELICLIKDVSLTNELISITKEINNMNFAINCALNESFCAPIPFNMDDCLNAHNYYESLLDEVVKNKFNKVLTKSTK